MTTQGRFCNLRISRQLKFSFAATAVAFLSTALSAQIFLTIDAPDAGTAPGQGTNALAINNLGDIAGQYIDSSGGQHGFLRSYNTGTITEFDPPNSTFTFVKAINKAGRIVGFSARKTASGSHEVGFLRMKDGTFFPVSVPGSLDTEPQAINDSGHIAGWYDDALGTHGFVWDGSGSYVIFDAPGTVTNVTGLSLFGQITGDYISSGVHHGFLRDALGNITTFDVPGASGTFPTAIAARGEVTGVYADSSNLAHSFTTDGAGNFTTFDCPDFDQTFATAITPNGIVVGQCETGANFKGFRRDLTGNVVPFTIPVANKGVSPTATNGWSSGGIVGGYVDLSGVSHGFRR